MDKKQYFEFYDRFVTMMTQTTHRKNADYAGHSDSPFANFEMVEKIGITTTETGFLTRMSDKLSRITTFNKTGNLQVKDESVTDTLADLANYCILFAAYLESKKEPTEIKCENKSGLFNLMGLHPDLDADFAQLEGLIKSNPEALANGGKTSYDKPQTKEDYPLGMTHTPDENK